MPIVLQLVWLFVLAIPIASIAWTITHEEIFRETREYCKRECNQGHIFKRKFFYLFTCEYCFSHYVVIVFLIITRYKLLYQDWRGYLLSLFALVWIANQYMSIYNRLSKVSRWKSKPGKRTSSSEKQPEEVASGK